MNKGEKDDILRMAQEENKGRDLAELEAGKHDSTIAIIVLCIVATAVLSVEAAIGRGLNFAVLVVISSINIALWIPKTLRNHSKIYIICSVAWSVAALCWVIAWLISLVK